MFILGIYYSSPRVHIPLGLVMFFIKVRHRLYLFLSMLDHLRLLQMDVFHSICRLPLVFRGTIDSGVCSLYPSSASHSLIRKISRLFVFYTHTNVFLLSCPPHSFFLALLKWLRCPNTTCSSLSLLQNSAGNSNLLTISVVTQVFLFVPNSNIAGILQVHNFV